MRPEHLQRLAPLCPTCRAAGRPAAALELGPVAKEAAGEVIEGALLCTERTCQREHPIIDGIPVVVADIASWAAHQLPGVMRRDDFSPYLESLLGDAAGPQAELHALRTNLGIYGWAHWGDLLPELPRRHGGAYARLLEQALALAQPAGKAEGLWLDLGCSVGRGTLELARAGAELAVGVDLNFSMLRVAEQVRRGARAVFPLRRLGVVFDRFDAAVAEVPAERMAYWCCDVGVLPLANGVAQGALLLNLLDCVPQPLGLLIEAGRVLAPGAQALLCSPYDWSPNATPMPQWLGGHSQRGPQRGDSRAELARICSADLAAGVDTGLQLADERDDLPWHVQTGERSTMEYRVHLARMLRR